MKEYLNKPTTRALIDTVIFIVLIVGIPAGIAQLLVWMGLDPVGLFLIGFITWTMWMFYSYRLDKYKRESIEDSEDQPLNS